MLKYFVKRSASEHYQSVSTPPSENTWVRGEEVTAEDLMSLSERYGFNLNVFRDVLDQNELPRVEVRNDIL